jgi:hypothetical protein
LDSFICHHSRDDENTGDGDWGALREFDVDVGNPRLLSVLLAKVQSLKNKLDEFRSRLFYQWDIKNGIILCFTESWLYDDTGNIQLAGFSVHRQDRTATSGKTRGGGVCLYVNNTWCVMSNINEVSRYCSPGGRVPHDKL